MPSLELLSLKDAQKNKKYEPIAIVKGDERNNYFNKFLCINKTDDTGKKRIDLTPDLIYELIPPTKPEKRSISYIPGASGSGKSYMAKILSSNYHKLYPNQPVFLISKLKSDETLDELQFIQRVDMDDFTAQPFDINGTEPSLIIFDDFETLEKDKLKIVLDAIDDISIMGRHKRISMIFISHNITNYKQTRLILNESHNIICFPQSTSYYQLKYLLKNYGNMDDNQVKHLRKLGRWSCIFTQYPNYVISQSSAYLLHQDE
tara:strand:+ start:4031 stop:4813 length:783 start_codon:yes stop_codon:yes gene_type:complete